MEENEQALPCIDKSLEFDPNSAFAWDAKASILSGLGRNEQALAAANEAVRMEACSSTRMTRAQVLTHMGKFYPAEKELDDIIKADPTNEGARSRRAMVAGHTHHWNKVIEDNTFLIQANKESLVKSTSTTFQDRAAAYINTKQYDKAIADYKTGLKINPDSRPLHSGLLNAYTLSGNTKAAQAERKVLESYDDDITPFK
jgi:tetratricopeptide (TPR) repeat protein